MIFLGDTKRTAQGKHSVNCALNHIWGVVRVITQPCKRGVKFDLSDNLEASANRDWLVIEVEHKGTQPQALEEEGGQGATTYHNTFTVLPADKTWRAKPQPKPQVDGPMIALVVGPVGEEIYCDEHGRVKVHFPWDRESEQNERSSCWVRVSQGWAGAKGRH